MSRPEMEWLSVHDLKAYENNPRVNEGAITAVMHSIEKHGFLQPIVVNQDNIICAGHTRWLAAKQLNMLRVPVIKQTMTEQEFIGFNLVDNKSHELSKWDKKLIHTCMEILDDLDAVKATGFTDKEIDSVFGHKHLETHNSDADFGDAGKVDDKIDPEAIEKRIAFVFNGKEHKVLTSKLKAIKKEHGLPNMAQALLKALEPYKGLSEPRLRKGNQ